MVRIFFIFFISSFCYAKTIKEIAEPYFKSSEYYQMVMSPNGQHLAAETYYDSIEHIEIVDIKNKKSYVIFNGSNRETSTISKINWVDNDTIIIQIEQTKSNDPSSIFKVMHLDINETIKVDSTFEFKKNGYIINPLPQKNNLIYFAHLINTKKYTSGAYLLDLSDKESVKNDFHIENKIGKSIRSAYYWLTDKNNNIRLIISQPKDTINYWVYKNQQWEKTHSLHKDSEDVIYPLAINPSNQFIAIKRLKNKDKKGVYIFNSEDLSVDKELFYSNDSDVSSIKINPANSQLLSVSYVKNGVMVDVLMNNKLQKAQQSLLNNYSTYKNYYISSNSDYTKHLFLIYNFQNEGIYVNVDLQQSKISKVIDKAAWRQTLAKGKLEVIVYQNDEGMAVESYLSLPQSKKPKALIVMPHGGPIGVRSYGYFDSMSHFFASHDIAVLKINYRGSSGFGKKFQESGKKQWGTKIEKDINDTVSYVLDNYLLDDNMICAAGSSYGGYSALMLHINYPQRYKCISSMAGPTDLPLMFTSSDWNINKESIKQMLEIVGDPHRDIEKLKTQSPLYNAKKIKAPVLLVHGTKDARVSIEHSIRLDYVLKKLNKPVKFIKVEGEKHGFNLLSNQINFATELLKFINKSLDLQLVFESE